MRNFIFVNATTSQQQHQTCVEPTIGHIIVCTWHCIFERYHQPIFRGVRNVQKNWLLNLPWFGSGRNIVNDDATKKATSMGDNG